jgi:hypothetical protein
MLLKVRSRPADVVQAPEQVRLVQNMRQGASDDSACKTRDAREQERGPVEAMIQKVVAQRACSNEFGSEAGRGAHSNMCTDSMHAAPTMTMHDANSGTETVQPARATPYCWDRSPM